MLNEWQEFLDYTGIVAYTAKSKNDISYMGRFTFTTILEFKGLARVLKIIARGDMFHDADGNILGGDPRERLDYVRKVLCAWCSVPELFQWGELFKFPVRPRRRGRIRAILKNCTKVFPSWLVRTAAVGSAAMFTVLPALC